MVRVQYRRKVAIQFADWLDRLCFNRLARLSARHNARRGGRMSVFANDHIGNAINVYGMYEREELDLLFAFLAPLAQRFSLGVALDIGANVGNHALAFSGRFAAVHAFEPNPAAFQLLAFNTARCANVQVHNVGLGDCGGTFALRESASNAGNAEIAVAATARDLPTVQVAVLDDLVLDVNDVCLMKIDVEGFEARVIRGAQRFISRHQPVIVFEQHQSEFVDGSTATLDLLHGLGYRILWQQSAAEGSNWLRRVIRGVVGLLAGVEQCIVTGTVVPARFHSMLIAMPPRFMQDVGVADV